MAVYEIITNNKGTVIPIDGYEPCCGVRPQLRVYGKRPHVDIVVYCEAPSCRFHGSGVTGYPEEFPEKWNKAVKAEEKQNA